MLPKDPTLVEEYKRRLSESSSRLRRTPEQKEKQRQLMLSRGVRPPSHSGKNHYSYNLPKELHPLFKGHKYCYDCGKKLTSRKYMRCGSCAHKGEHSGNWKGGITTLYNQIRNLYEFRQWRNDVFTRDCFTCQECGRSKVYLECHHIKSFKQIIQENSIRSISDALRCAELWNINNGKTLCECCHSLTPNHKGRNIALLKAASLSPSVNKVIIIEKETKS